MSSSIQRIVAAASAASISTCLLLSMEATTSVHGVANETHLGTYGLIVPDIVDFTVDMLSRAAVSIGVYSSLLFQSLAMIVCFVGLAVHWYPGRAGAIGYLILACASPGVMYSVIHYYSGPNTASMWPSSWVYPVLLLLMLPVSAMLMMRAAARPEEPLSPEPSAGGAYR